MNVFGKNYKTIWEKQDAEILTVEFIDQRRLPFSFNIEETSDFMELVQSIKDMTLRGAPLIGVAGAYAVCLAVQQYRHLEPSRFRAKLGEACHIIATARPTAVNLNWAVESQKMIIESEISNDDVFEACLANARKIFFDDIENCRKIGENGLKIIQEIAARKPNEVVNILTHCNAGWLATIEYGTALAPIYAAHKAGINVHVWVDETRPRNQGSKLTAFELFHENIPHTIIADNAGGHLMQHRMVDLVIVGADRVTASGDVCNKIGTYLKALAANDNSVPFYAALPVSTFDMSIRDGIREIKIEERDPDEVLFVEGIEKNRSYKVRVSSEGSNARNYGFDVTPARLVSGLITERGIVSANEASIMAIF